MRKLTTQDKFSLFYPLRMWGEANPFPGYVFSGAGTPGGLSPSTLQAATEKSDWTNTPPRPRRQHFLLLFLSFPPPSSTGPFSGFSFTSSTVQLCRPLGGMACALGAWVGGGGAG